ncbi:MAG: hypothetical protein ACOZF0_03585 [Thermodesulfobacteriota bacterium]
MVSSVGGRSAAAFLLFLGALLCLHDDRPAMAAGKEEAVPRYILNGLQTYRREGYEAAVAVWLKDSPWANATLMVSRIAYFKNIEKLYGRYQGYQIVTTQETRTSQMTYVRFIYEKNSGYGMFLSTMRNNAWVLSQIDLHRTQRYADTNPR